MKQTAVADANTPAPLPFWQPPVDRARDAVLANDASALRAADDELGALLAQSTKPLRRGAPLVRLYRSLARWKIDGTFTKPYSVMPEAQIQIWEMEARCAEVGYQKAFVDAAVKNFPRARGFRMFKRIFDTVDMDIAGFRDDGRKDVQCYRRAGATITILGFAGRNDQFAGIGWTMFDRAIASRLNANLIVLRDPDKRLYLAGIRSLGDYAESIAAVQAMLEEFSDTQIVAAGGSGGVFGAINMAADIGIRHIVAFAGPTSLEIGEQSDERQIYRNIAADIAAGRYDRPELAAKVNASAVARIDFFVARDHAFDYSQMRDLADKCPCVVPHVYPDFDGHIVTDLAIDDGSIFEAFRASSA